MTTPTKTVADGLVVAIHYTLRDDKGEVLDHSPKDQPLEYLHGAGNIVPGLEKQLAGHTVGDKFEAKVAPAEGYGNFDPRGIERVPRSEFPPNMKLEPGMQFTAESADGQQHLVWVRALEGNVVVIDMNHPLAGKTLHFDVTIAHVRPPTKEEIAHGHTHGAGGHHHH